MADREHRELKALALDLQQRTAEVDRRFRDLLDFLEVLMLSVPMTEVQRLRLLKSVADMKGPG